MVKTVFFVLALGFTGCAVFRSSKSVRDSYLDSSPQEQGGFKKVILPLGSGVRYEVSQGAFGKSSHQDPGYEYAWDFDVPFGTAVVSVEAGRVIQVWEPQGTGGCDPKLSSQAHNIKVVGEDGTVAQYVHVRSLVRVGDWVKKGQTIAKTENNGFLCSPQLHFNFFRDVSHLPENGKAESIPVLFQGLPSPGLARPGIRGIVGY